ncbi:MAG: uroporphyrinogen decarboxylase family protein, partial [Candidatus Latescibacterota bacterium]
ETQTERGERDWKKTEQELQQAEQKGRPRHGYAERLFDRLYLLRGFENLMFDIATDDPHLPKLIDMLVDYELRLVQKWLDMGVDAIGFHTDIGSQHALMISPRQFRKYIKPMFKKIFGVCRDAGVHVSLSSDGRLLEIVDDLIECGVSMHDPQFRANTLEGIEAAYKGKMCINLDLDRQMFPFCTPDDIKRQIDDVIERLGSSEGGLMLIGAIYGRDVPLENIEALCSGLEESCW